MFYNETTKEWIVEVPSETELNDFSEVNDTTLGPMESELDGQYDADGWKLSLSPQTSTTTDANSGKQ